MSRTRSLTLGLDRVIRHRGSDAHRNVRAFLAGVALPSIVVCAAELVAAAAYDRLAPPYQRALLLPIAVNPVVWGLWNALWFALGPGKRARIGWHGVLLGALLIGVGVLAAPALGVCGVTPQRGAIALIPTSAAYYVFWRYGVAVLNSLVGLDDGRGEVAQELT
jgi:hypothetical protein